MGLGWIATAIGLLNCYVGSRMLACMSYVIARTRLRLGQHHCLVLCMSSRLSGWQQGMGLGRVATFVGSIICLDGSRMLACPVQ